jgi:aromatic-L-amino-acid decarboxylase
MKTELDLPLKELKAAASRISVAISAFHEGSRNQPVLEKTDPEQLAGRFDASAPVEGTPISSLVDEAMEIFLSSARRNDSPRFFGYVCSGGSDAGALADFLASGVNQNVTAWRSAPAATEMERQVIRWLAGITGMPSGTEGLLLGGGSSANFTALAAARDAMAGADVSRAGMITLGREMVLYGSEETHMSIPRAASLLGLGRDSFRRIPTNPQFQIDIDHLRRQIKLDRKEGRIPFCVVGNAGTTATGAVDPLNELAELCTEESMWLHVDGAYGGFARLAANAPEELDALGLADSLSVDPHKWLHVPFDCGALLVKSQKALMAPFTEVGAYARTEENSRRAAYTFFENGPELSRRARALKVWMVFRHLGTRALGRYIDHDLEMARILAEKVSASPDLELLAPVPLSVVCFRYTGDETDEGKLEQLNRKLLDALQQEARVYPTHAEPKGKFALRACILNPRTEEEDLDALVEETCRLGSSLSR